MVYEVRVGKDTLFKFTPLGVLVVLQPGYCSSGGST